MVAMNTHQPLQLVVEEPEPGTFVWTLMETDAGGQPVKVVRRAEEPAGTYEAALAAGTRALDAQLHPRAAAGA